MRHTVGKLTIDLGAIGKNYKTIQNRVGQNCTVSAVVKADGFGLGAEEVTGALIEAGCRHFFVATPEEGIELRTHYKDPTIYILNGYYESYAQEFLNFNLIPVLGSFQEIEAYKTLTKKNEKKFPALLHFNTRMNRLGLAEAELQKIYADMKILEGINITGIMSHFACADEPEHNLNSIQYQLFKEITQHFPGVKRILSNSFGTFRDESYAFDMVRPGYALYGGNPVPGQQNPMTPVVSLELPIIRTRLVYKGAVVGYGATYRFDKDSQIATVSGGYADGLFRSLSNRGALYWKGIRCPIRGRVSMDLTTVDLSGVPDDQHPGPDDFLELLGPNQDIDTLARDAGTIGYEILTALGQRYEREYVRSPSASRVANQTQIAGHIGRKKPLGA